MSTMTAVNQAPEVEQEDAEKPRSKKKLLIIVVALLLVAAAAWWFFLKPSGPEEPKPGEIVPLEATQINLASGHYLKVGVALQLTEGASEIDGSKALDATIDLFSGLPVSEVSRPKSRHHLKEQLVKELEKRYEGDVMGVYFTEFVTQ